MPKKIRSKTGSATKGLGGIPSRNQGITIPGGGAMGGGDDYRQKIGRNKIPWTLDDFQGSPSMSADAGFSSIVMQRIASPDAVTHSRKPMFPDQEMKEADVEDNYIMADEDTSETEKKMKTKRMKFDENQSVNHIKYSLVDLDNIMNEDVDWDRLTPKWAHDIELDDFVPPGLEDEFETAKEYVSDVIEKARELGQPAYDLVASKLDKIRGQEGAGEEFLDKVKETAKEIGKDLIALTAAGIPVVGTPIALWLITWNLGELQASQNDALRVTDSLLVNGTEADIAELEAVSNRMFDDYIDLMQATWTLIPFVGSGKTAAKIVGKAAAVTGVKKGSSFVGLAGPSVMKSAIKSEILLKPLFKIVAKFKDVDAFEDLELDKTYFLENFYKGVGTLVVLQEFLEEAHRQLAQWRQEGSTMEAFKFDPSQMGFDDSSDYEESEGRLGQNTYDAQLRDAIDSMTEKIIDATSSDTLDTVIEGKNMNKDENLLRLFIREKISRILESTYPHPVGYEYRNPPTSEEEDDEYDSNIGDIVNFKTDMGGVSYQSRPENIREEALRRIVRRKIQEQKKRS